MPLRFFFPFLALFLLANYATSQVNNFKHWSIQDGLPQSNVYCIKQDKRGFIWIGTGNGVSCFDGKKFKSYSIKEGLSGNVVRSIMEDSSGRLWFGTDKGISIYNGFEFFTLGKPEGLMGSTVLCFIEDNNKTIWSGTDDNGINKIVFNSKNDYSITNYNESLGLSSNAVFDLYFDKYNSIWAATFGGINILYQKDDKITVKVINGEENIPSDLLLSISEDNKGDLWFGTYNAGAFKFDLNSGNTIENQINVVSYNTSNGLNANSVWDILCTQDNSIWFGTSEKGINRFTPQKNSDAFLITTYSSKQSFSSDQILCFFEDKQSNIWIGTNGDGLFMLPGDHFSHYSLKEGIPTKIQGIAQDKDSNIWIVSDGGGLAVINNNKEIPFLMGYTEKEGLSSSFLTCIATGKAGNTNIWMGTSSRGIIKYDGNNFTTFDENNGLISNRVNAVFIDKNGILWCGTANGISRYDGIKFLNVSTDMLTMENQGVKAIIQDKKDNIWFGTAGGLARYNGKGEMKTFDMEEGLLHIDINAITEDIYGNIWIGTNGGGIYKFNGKKKEKDAIEFIANENFLSSNSIRSLIFLNDSTLIAGTYKGFDKLFLDKNGKVLRSKNYNSSDGFIGVECNDNSIHKDADDNIWFGTGKGLTRYSSYLEKNISTVPKVYISNLQLFYKNVNWSQKTDSILPFFNVPFSLQLPHNENNLTFYFSAISLSNPDKLKYTYLLEGRDEEWSPIKPDNDVTFSGLTPGNYTLKIRAIDSNSNWSEPALFTFTISPPWYQSLMFYLLCAFIIGLGIYGFIRYRERALLNEKKILEQIVSERTRELVLQKEKIAEKNREITDSINYAKGIQDAILPTSESIQQWFPKSFVLFKPKAIVSGDFYWMEKVDHKLLFAAIDCTGHGVPGGFVSMVGANGLNRSVKEYNIIKPSKILDRLSELVEETFSKRKDGMDIALCSINSMNNTLEYSGANNSMYLVRKSNIPLNLNGEFINPVFENSDVRLFEIKADKQPIGSFDNRKAFTNHLLELMKDDTIYVFTDGYADQFGGQNGKKFKYNQLKELFVSIHNLTMEEQQVVLAKTIEDWKGNLEQIDDICIVGVKI
ncbi:MAG: SpoIIE family protein phosphatase [Bacteroidetes bacterium]|nr:SpoIIE family protein phosphatase [Bacteroidota bacterium]HET6245912.1 two-component regulator propeller domain-containing protein [Bacteroidia bacterium]